MLYGFWQIIKWGFNEIYTSEWGMTAIVMVVVFVYVFIKFAQWNDKKEYEQIKKRQEEKKFPWENYILIFLTEYILII